MPEKLHELQRLWLIEAVKFNVLGLEVTTIESPDPLPAGDVHVQLDFVYDGGGLGKGGAVALYIDGNQVAEGRLEITHATIFSADSTASVGKKAGAPISEDFSRTGKHTFNGRVHWVHVEVGDQGFIG